MDKFLFVASASADAAEVVVLHSDRLGSFSRYIEVPQFLFLLIFSYLKLNVCGRLGAFDSGSIQHLNLLKVVFVLLAFCVIYVVDVVTKLFRLFHHLLVMLECLSYSRVLMIRACINVFIPGVLASFSIFVLLRFHGSFCFLTGFNNCTSVCRYFLTHFNFIL